VLNGKYQVFYGEGMVLGATLHDDLLVSISDSKLSFRQLKNRINDSIYETMNQAQKKQS